MKPLSIRRNDKMKAPKKKIDAMLDTIKFGELMPITPKIGQRGAKIINTM